MPHDEHDRADDDADEPDQHERGDHAADDRGQRARVRASSGTAIAAARYRAARRSLRVRDRTHPAGRSGGLGGGRPRRRCSRSLGIVAWYFRVIWPPLILAGAIVFILNPVVTFLQRRHIPRALGTGIAYLGVVGVVVLGGVPRRPARPATRPTS